MQLGKRPEGGLTVTCTRVKTGAQEAADSVSTIGRGIGQGFLEELNNVGLQEMEGFGEIDGEGNRRSKCVCFMWVSVGKVSEGVSENVCGCEWLARVVV